MPKAKNQKPLTPSNLSNEIPEDPKNLHKEIHGDIPETVTEEDATMQVTIKGSPKGVADAASKVAGGAQPPTRKDEQNETHPPDVLGALLSDPKNMVIVTRKFPRVYTRGDGKKVRCAVRVEKYICPVRREEIEDDVFTRFGGQSYNVTIHPNTTTGENTILGAFTIEHPNPEEPPYIDDDSEDESIASGEAVALSIPSATDPTMRETDPLFKMKADLERRLERARLKKEIEELERTVQELEGNGEQKRGGVSTPAPDPRDKEIAELKAALETKKNEDRFAALQNSMIELTKTVQSLASRLAEYRSGADEGLVFKILTQSQNHSKEMLDIIKTMHHPPPPPAADASENFDRMLDRFVKMKTVFGGDDTRVSKLQDQLLEMAIERLLGGDGESGDEEDTMKFAIKQFTPVLRTYVERQLKEEEDGKKEISKERIKEIYQQAAEKAAKDLEEKWRKDGWLVRDPRLGSSQLSGLPAPQSQRKPPSVHRGPVQAKVVSRQETPKGIIEHVQVEPSDLSQKKANAAEGGGVQYTEMPGIGKVEVPARPGEPKYDRRKSVNYVLDSILSEIAEGAPAKGMNDPAAESFVPADALEYLDHDLLAEIHKVTSGEELEAVLLQWGDRAKIEKIKEAGKDKAVDSWIRRLIRTIQDIWRDQQQK
jgi:hypothetical protein